MNWAKGYTASYYASIVDPKTWKDVDTIQITGGTINHTETGLRESADIECTDFNHGIEQWIRVWMDVEQAGERKHVPLFTGIASSPDRSIEGSLSQYTLKCYSVLKPASDILLPQGWYAAKGFSGGDVIRKLLKCCNAPVEVEGNSPRLLEYLVAEQGETNLTMIEKILDAIGWRIKISGDGTILVCPKTSKVIATFESLKSDVLKPSVSVEYDMFDCPNVFRATSGSTSVEARDNADDSALSIQNRGREVWKEDTSVTLTDGETLQRYAKRRLKELQGVAMTVSYDRRFNDSVYVGDIVRLNYPAQNLIGKFRITSQKISLVTGTSVAEEAVIA